jgi:hypothetical protein
MSGEGVVKRDGCYSEGSETGCKTGPASLSPFFRPLLHTNPAFALPSEPGNAINQNDLEGPPRLIARHTRRPPTYSELRDFGYSIALLSPPIGPSRRNPLASSSMNSARLPGHGSAGVPGQVPSPPQPQQDHWATATRNACDSCFRTRCKCDHGPLTPDGYGPCERWETVFCALPVRLKKQ